MTIDTRARRASRAVRKTDVPAADFGAFLRHAAAARRRRRIAVASLVIAALLGIVLPLSGVYQDYRKIAPTQRGRDRVQVTPTPPPAQSRSQGLGTGTGARPQQSKSSAPTTETQTDAQPAAAAGRIFYASSEGGAADSIWVMKADGSDRRQLAQGIKPDPSPDGRRVAFVRDPEECYADPTAGKADCAEIWVMNDDGSGQRRLGLGDSPDWSPDGGRIAFTKWRESPNGDVHIMNADGSGVRKLARGETTAGMRPRWSPDGRWIALTSPPEGDYGCSGIYITEVDGPGERWLPKPGCYIGTPNWSPDGKQIAFFSSRGNNTLDIGIYVASSDGSNVRRLTSPWNGDEPHHEISPSWSPDGKRIAYTFDADGDQGLYGPAFTYCRAIGPGGSWTDCRPPGPMPGDVYMMDADGADSTRLTPGHYPEFSS